MALANSSKAYSDKLKKDIDAEYDDFEINSEDVVVNNVSYFSPLNSKFQRLRKNSSAKLIENKIHSCQENVCQLL